MNFKVTIKRVITTELLVKTDNRTDTRLQIRNYGLTEAINDYKVINEDVRMSLGFAEPIGE